MGTRAGARRAWAVLGLVCACACAAPPAGTDAGQAGGAGGGAAGGGAGGGGAGGAGGGAAQPDGGLPLLRKLHTEHLGRWTGTPTNPLRNVGITGTDLGVSFERDGQLVFLFGDSWTVNAGDQDKDSIARAPRELPADGGLPRLDFVTNQFALFMAPTLPGVNLGPMNVPVEGVADAARSWLFFSSGYSASSGVHSRSVLAQMTGTDLTTLALVHDVASTRFINVSVVLEGDVAWIFGSGPYRKSAVYLARARLTELGDRSKWTYFGGLSDTQPLFLAGEASAVPVVPSTCVGELSVRRHAALDALLLAYNCDAPRGILLHAAPRPWGPWSQAVNVFDPAESKDSGYEHFIHAKESVLGVDDGLSERGREEEWGGEYGPYLVPAWFEEGPPGVHFVTYALSSWNPYQVHLMRTALGEPGATWSPAPKGQGLPKAALVNGDFSQGLAGWQSSGGTFALFTGADGKPRLTTYVPPSGDAVTGRLWQDFTVDDATRELSFTIHGGDAVVQLLVGDEVVRQSRGRRANSPETPVRWRLDDLAGRTVRLRIDDALTGAWGFVGVSGFTLQ